LRAIAEQAANGPGAETARMLLGQADREMADSQALLGRAGGTPDAAGNVPTQRLNMAARGYVTTLAALGGASPADKAQVAMINHAVKEVLDADHIRQMGMFAGGSGAIEPLMAHAQNMRNEGTQTLLRLAGNGPIDPNAPSVATLARRGREVIDAAGELGAVMAAQVGAAPGATPGSTLPPVGPNPGRFQDNRPEIIGGTYGTSNPTTGTYNGKGDPLNPAGIPPIQNSGAPTPSPADRANPTTSNGGLPPR